MNNIWSKFGHKNGSGTFQWSILITFGINIYSPPSVSSVPFLPSLTVKAKCEMGWGFHMWYVRGMGGEGSIYYDGGSWFIFSNISVGLWKILNNQKSSFTKLSSILIQKKIFQTWNPIFIFLQMFIDSNKVRKKSPLLLKTIRSGLESSMKSLPCSIHNFDFVACQEPNRKIPKKKFGGFFFTM